MALLASTRNRRSGSTSSYRRPPIERLEDRRLLSASVIIGPIGPIGPIFPLSAVSGLTIHATDSVPFSGSVAVWKGNLPKAPTPTQTLWLKALASIQWGDGTSTAGTLVQDGNGIVQIDGTHTYGKPGTFATLTNVSEVPVAKPGTPLPQFIVEVGQGAGKAIVAGQSAGAVTIYTKVNFPFTGPVANLSFKVPSAHSISVYAATINWGDGTTSAGTFADNTATGNSDVIGSHTYKKAGKFDVHVVVTLGPAPGSGAEFPTRIVATIDSTANVAKPYISLEGTIAGTYKLAPAVPDIGATYVFTGSGNAGALGPVGAAGSVHLPGFIASGMAGGTLTLTSASASPGKAGSVTLKLTGPTEAGFGPFPTTLSFVITSSTGAFANVAGIGNMTRSDVLTDWRAVHGNHFAASVALITGGAGFIGSHLAQALTELGASVIVLDNLVGGSRENLAGFAPVQFVEGSILDQDLLARCMGGCRYVFHQAALGSVPASVEQPRLFHEVNTTGTLNVLEAARSAGVRRVMFAASSSAYGDNGVPWIETMPPLPRSPYAATKLAGEGLLRAYSSSYGLDTAALRYFNVFGPRQNANSAYAAVIAAFAKAILGKQRPVIFGDGEQSRDFTYVDNVVHANLLAAHRVEPIGGEVLNVGCGERISVNRLAAVMAAALRKKDLSPDHQAERAGDLKHSYADLERSRQCLGYQPIVAFDTGLSRTLEWYEKELG